MRQLTFPGFLKTYVRTLSSGSSLRLATLADEAAKNPRLREPLALYALFHGAEERLQAYAQKHDYSREYAQIFANYNAHTMHTALKNKAPELPTAYKKVFSSYLAQKNRHKTDQNTKNLMRKRVLKLKQKHAVTNYRIYTDLELNHGNVNAWLKHGQPGKVSLATARSILNYLRSLDAA